MTTRHENPDGTATFYIDSDALHAASMLEGGEVELDEEEFEELVDAMREAREEADAGGSA